MSRVVIPRLLTRRLIYPTVLTHHTEAWGALIMIIFHHHGEVKGQAELQPSWNWQHFHVVFKDTVV